jgi:hypothetical protein
VDVAQNGGKDDEELPFVQESEVTNPNNTDYVEEDEEGEDKDMLSTASDAGAGVKAVAMTGEKCKKDQRHMIREIKVPDSKGNKDVRPKKKTKGSTAVKSLDPRDEVQEKTPPGEMNDLRQEKGNDSRKEKKVKKGMLLWGAVNDLHSEQNLGSVIVTGSASAPRTDLGKPDKPTQYVCSHLLNMSMLTLSQLTLYYWNLSSDTIKKDSIIRNWATTVSKLSSSL